MNTDVSSSAQKDAKFQAFPMVRKDILDNIDGAKDDMSTVLEDRELRRGVHSEEVHIHVLARQRIEVIRGVVDALLFQCRPHFLAVERIGVVVQLHCCINSREGYGWCLFVMTISLAMCVDCDGQTCKQYKLIGTLGSTC
jgi:hypothetical protein